MKIAVAQTQSGGNLGKNLARAEALSIQAAQQGSTIILFSELFAHSYEMGLYAKAPLQNSFILNSLSINRSLQPLREVSRKHNIIILFGAATRDDAESTQLYNSIVAVFPDGEVSEQYRKIHLWEGETESFAAGNEGKVLQVGNVRIGLGICFDAGFPDFSRSYFEQDVDAILFSSAFLEGEQKIRYNTYHAARAVENNTYVAVSNAVGKTEEGVFFGESYAVDPYGVEIFRQGNAEEFAIFSIDQTVREKAKTELPFQKDNQKILKINQKTLNY